MKLNSTSVRCAMMINWCKMESVYYNADLASTRKMINSVMSVVLHLFATNVMVLKWDSAISVINKLVLANLSTFVNNFFN